MRIGIALLLAWAIGLIVELGRGVEAPAAAVGAVFLLAWFTLGAAPGLRRGVV